MCHSYFVVELFCCLVYSCFVGCFTSYCFRMPSSSGLVAEVTVDLLICGCLCLCGLRGFGVWVCLCALRLLVVWLVKCWGFCV